MITDKNLFTVLNNWNLWSHKINYGILRYYYLNKIMPLLNRKEILIIKGIRRSGKSTIMKQLMKLLISKGIEKNQILYINLEDYSLKDSLTIKLFEQTIQVYNLYVNNDENKTIYFFIDEIQLIPEWERYLRTIYDLGKNIKFIISGSNASLLSKELSTLLTGRNLTIQINTLNFEEFKQFTKKDDLKEFLTYGGFPEIVLEQDKLKKKMLLQQYFEDIINKDILARHNIRNSESVLNLARYLIENSGGKQSMNKLSKTFGIDDKTTAEYISYMIDAYLIYKVPFFSYSIKKRFNKLTQPKYYSSDNGFFQITSLQFTKNDGKLFENAIFLEINSNYKDIAYWSNKGEVDFIFGNKALNVTTAKIVPEREYAGLNEFLKNKKIFELLLITPNSINETKQSPIKILNISNFSDYINNGMRKSI